MCIVIKIKDILFGFVNTCIRGRSTVAAKPVFLRGHYRVGKNSSKPIRYRVKKPPAPKNSSHLFLYSIMYNYVKPFGSDL